MSQHYPPRPAQPPAPGWPQQPPTQRVAAPPPRAGHSTKALAVVGVLAFLAGVGFGMVGDEGDASAPAAAGARPAASAKPAASPKPKPSPAGPATVIREGTWRVGKDIRPGTYRTTGPTYQGGSCYWERLSSMDGTMDAVLANGGGSGVSVVTIRPGDKGFSSEDCKPWRRIS
jgi:hypothetical protein